MGDGCVVKMKLKNQVAMILGIKSELAKVIALSFANEGAKVIICDSDYTYSKEISNQIEHIGVESIALRCNPTRKRDIKRVIKKSIKRFEKVDILVNCFDLFLQKPIFETKEREWNKIIRSNLNSCFLSVREISTHMIENKKGKIIFISSVFGKVGFNEASAYSASNGGIDNLTRELALELSPSNINVNCISPGIISTKAGNMFDLENKKIKRKLLSDIPIGRFGTPEEVADAVIFLSSNDSDFITGHNLVVDGGWLAH